jgi:hypothetical protein
MVIVSLQVAELQRFNWVYLVKKIHFSNQNDIASSFFLAL